jgi:hypothetical protein
MTAKPIDLRVTTFIHRYLFDGVLLLLISILFTPLFFLDIFRKTTNDYRIHLAWAMQVGTDLAKIPGYILAHSLWQYLVFGIHLITLSPYKVSAFLITIGSVALAGWVIYREFLAITDRAAWPKWTPVGLSIGLLVVNPISLLALRDHFFYLGYIAMNSYHNPTILLLKPIALLQFIYTVHSFTRSSISGKEITILAVLSILSAYAKPSFTICLLPALGALVGLRWLMKQSIPWKAMIWGIGLPSAAVLIAQFYMSYTGNQDGRVIFAPLGVMQSYSDNLLPKLILSLLFPLLLTIVYRKQVVQSPSMLVAWTCFIFGAFYSYFMAESGARFHDGNFEWSGEITIFILFFASTAFFLEMLAKTGFLKNIYQKLISGVWGLHLLAGVIYLVYSTLINGYY